MLYSDPKPLLEAHLFLIKRQSGDSVARFFTRWESTNLPGDIPMTEYIDILTELELRMESAIDERSESEITMLYNSFDETARADFPSMKLVANLIVGEIANLCREDCFERIRANKAAIPNTVLHDILDKQVADSDMTDMIMRSRFSAENKLLLFDILAHPDKFTDMLERILIPIAAEFARCGELIAPLITHYKEVYGSITTLEAAFELLSSTLKRDLQPIKQWEIYPQVSFFNMHIYDFTGPRSECAFMGAGVLNDILKKYYKVVNMSVKMSGVLSVLGNRNRFDIMLALAEGRKYGRELANILNLTSANVYQHMDALLTASLVKCDTSGNRVYYSINYTATEALLNTLRGILESPAEHEQHQDL